MKGIYLSIFIKRHLQRYIVESVGSNVIRLEKDRTLISIIKPHLTLAGACEEEEVPEGYAEIMIQLPDVRYVHEAATDTIYRCDTLFRDHITPVGASKVRRFIENTFRNDYRMFLDGYVESQTDRSDSGTRLRITDGILSFLARYNIEPDEKLIEAIRRDWYRHRDMVDARRFTPLLY